MFKNAEYRDNSGCVQFHIDENLEKLKHLKILVKWAEDKMQEMRDYAIKTKEKYLDEIDEKILKESK